MTKPILYDFFYKKAEALLSLYSLSGEQKSSINIGDNREIFLNKFLNKIGTTSHFLRQLIFCF